MVDRRWRRPDLCRKNLRAVARPAPARAGRHACLPFLAKRDRDDRARRDARLRPGHPRLPRRPGAAPAGPAHRRMRWVRLLGEFKYQVQHRDAAHRQPRDAPRAPRLGELELRDQPRSRHGRRFHRHALLDELAAGRLEPRKLFRHHQSSRGHRPRKGPPSHRLRAPAVQPRGRARAGRTARAPGTPHGTRTRPGRFSPGALCSAYGFHEDGLLSAYNLSAQLLGRDPWPAT